MMNVESIGILGILGNRLDKIGHGSIRIVKIKALKRPSLVQHKMIS